MKKKILFIILRLAKLLGLFSLARRITAGDLRILCYHGAAVKDEGDFRPGLFMTRQIFSARMQFLADNDYPVLPLGEALDKLGKRGLPSGSTVITIDDGWYGTYSVMVPILQRRNYPSTLYVASYYLQTQMQVFNVAIPYLLWMDCASVLDLSTLASDLSGTYRLAEENERDSATQAICSFMEAIDRPEARQALLAKLAKSLDIDWQSILADRLISFMSESEAREALAAGVDIQLHTHRHRFPDSDFQSAKKEIDDNRQALAGIAGGELVHFCYPSGEYKMEQVSWLQEMGVESATTTRSGFNRPDASLYELTRFLDSGAVSPLEFEAEMCGFLELIRRAGYAI